MYDIMVTYPVGAIHFPSATEAEMKEFIHMLEMDEVTHVSIKLLWSAE